MMHIHQILTFFLLTSVSCIACGQAPPPAQEQKHLQPIAYLVGGTWTAQGELPGFGPYTAERSYRWVLGKKFIEQRHVMRLGENEMETKGILGWHPAKKTIATWGFGNDGGIVSAQATTITQDELRIEGVREAAFNAGPIRATFRRVSDNEFLEIAETKKGEQWVPMFTFRFKRTKDG